MPVWWFIIGPIGFAPRISGVRGARGSMHGRDMAPCWMPFWYRAGPRRACPGVYWPSPQGEMGSFAMHGSVLRGSRMRRRAATRALGSFSHPHGSTARDCCQYGYARGAGRRHPAARHGPWRAEHPRHAGVRAGLIESPRHRTITEYTEGRVPALALLGK